ncbi:MAG: organic solvent tolerance protein OstA [Desulfovibrionales bacterium]|nr:organic solvent tolerance protein OstA [Desulfovibrionales bacterium]
MKSVLRILTLTLLMTATVALAAHAANTDDVKITSNKMTYSADGQSVVFIGNVVVKHPQADLWANKVTVKLQSDPSEPADSTGITPGKVREIIAEGDVRIKMENDRTGTAQRVVYTLTDELIVMTGKPKLSDGKNTIAGTTIKFWVKENRSEVLGSSSKPVEAIFSAPGKVK